MTLQKNMTAESAPAAETEVAFLGVPIVVGPDVLVPRMETELLARAALDLLAPDQTDPRIVDMCCGSGNLAFALAGNVPGAKVWACDLTDQTIASCTANGVRLGMNDRVTVLQGDLFGALDDQALEGTIDLIVANPPYISSGRLETEAAQLLENEPREAFDGGPYGMSIHQRLVRESVPFLKPGGWLAFEFGLGQERQAKALLKRTRAFAEPRFVEDEDGNPRVALAQRLDAESV